MNIRKIKDQKKDDIKEFKIKKKEELDNRLSFLKAACKCFGGYDEKETKLTSKHRKTIK